MQTIARGIKMAQAQWVSPLVQANLNHCARFVSPVAGAVGRYGPLDVPLEQSPAERTRSVLKLGSLGSWKRCAAPQASLLYTAWSGFA